MKDFNVKTAARSYRSLIAKNDAVIAKAEDSKLMALCAVSNEFQLYHDGKARKEFTIEVFGEGRAAASRRAEANKMMVVAPFYKEMKKAYRIHSKADDNATKPRVKDYVLKLATALRKADRFDAADSVAREVYLSMVVKPEPGKAKPVNVDHLVATINKLTAAQKRKVLKALES